MANKENKPKKFLHLSFKISDNSLGIFDKSKVVLKEEFDINEKTFVLLKNNNQIIKENIQSKIKSNSNSDNPDQYEEIILFKVRPGNEEYIQLENNFLQKSQALTKNLIYLLNYKLWYVIKNYPEDNEKDVNNINEDNINEDYYLCLNDIIRLGNFKFILREIHLGNYNNDFFTTYKNKLKYDIHDINKNNNPVFEFYPKLKSYFLEENKNIICSICNTSICDINNPIVSLCDCEFYKNKHYKCLKEKFKKQLDIVQNQKKTSINYILKKINCFNCQNQIPLSFTIEIENKENKENNVNKIYELIDFEKPEGKDYLFFESLEYITKDEDYEKSFHLIELNNNNNDNDITEITIGRDGSKEKHRDNDIKIFEPSVSRGKHAVIEYNKKEGTLLLKNKSKKSYTLIAIKEGLRINKNKIQLQIGRTFIEACYLKENEIKEIKKIKTREEYEEEIEEEIKRKIKEEENEQKNTEKLTSDNYFDHSEDENIEEY